MGIYSNQLRRLATSVLATTLAAVPVLAQSGQQEPRQPARQERAAESPQVHIVKHDAIVGAPVTNGRQDDKLDTLGNVSDLVMDGQSGQVRYAVLASGGTLRHWQEAHGDLLERLGVGRRERPIHALDDGRVASEVTGVRPFDPSRLDRLGHGDAVEASGGYGSG
jgi:hypothetical protein